ncbi:heavy-metal-associated domain-containing protein [Phenylobacterium sp.]|uniref:heavy-metal-associated domain-containing protein n=1 Tax=Phenylobacterium sp. TaxID=1871053 RepID=UPI0028A27E5C|nr:heavy-metal-associated domain-containing protein [Phenylobacterium sp.]
MLSFQVEGMSCGHCVQTVTKAIQGVEPKAVVAVDLATGRVTVQGGERREAIAQAIRDAGYALAA